MKIETKYNIGDVVGTRSIVGVIEAIVIQYEIGSSGSLQFSITYPLDGGRTIREDELEELYKPVNQDENN